MFKQEFSTGSDALFNVNEIREPIRIKKKIKPHFILNTYINVPTHMNKNSCKHFK